MSIPVLTAAVLLGYAAALWWLLRRESWTVLLALVVVCGVSLALRLAYTGDCPGGFDEDELAKFSGAVLAQRSNRLFVEDRSGWPVLLNVLFQAPLLPVFGPTNWTIRMYSLVTSVLASAVAFAAARAMGVRVMASLAAAALLAVLPWAIFYGRVSSGGELVFHELLLVAALARLLWCAGSWPEMLIGTLGLCGLLYDYGCGRVLLGLPVAAAVLATGRRRLWCLAIPVVALLGWVPYVMQNPSTAFSTFTMHVPTEAVSHPLQMWSTGMAAALRAFVSPAAQDGWLTIRSAAMHPPLVLGLALIGALIPLRVSLYLWAGFLAGLLPVALTDNALPSTHRMLMAFPFVALAAARALGFIKWRVPRYVASAIVVAVAAVQSVPFYFSPAFWPIESWARFYPETAALALAIPIPAPGRVFVMQEVNPAFMAHGLADPHYEWLAADNWFPPDHQLSMYAFAPHAALLRPFYENLVRPERVRAFGRAFLVTLEAGDWSWMRQHGWAYEAHCGETVRRTQVPALFHNYLTFASFTCPMPITHIWRGRWNGPHAQMRLRFGGKAVVETPAGRVAESDGRVPVADFVLEPGMDVSVTVTLGGSAVAALMELTPAGERIPSWDSVTPTWPDVAER